MEESPESERLTSRDELTPEIAAAWLLNPSDFEGEPFGMPEYSELDVEDMLGVLVDLADHVRFYLQETIPNPDKKEISTRHDLFHDAKFSLATGQAAGVSGTPNGS